MRNFYNELEKLKDPDCIWLCDKHRGMEGKEGSFEFWFDKASYQYLECEEQLPTLRLAYSRVRA